MRKYQVTILINDFEQGEHLTAYADANNIYEALSAANLSILEKFNPGVARDPVRVDSGEKYGFKAIPKSKGN